MKFRFPDTAKMSGYWFSLTGIFPYEDRVVDSVLIWENTVKGNPYFGIIYAAGGIFVTRKELK